MINKYKIPVTCVVRLEFCADAESREEAVEAARKHIADTYTGENKLSLVGQPDEASITVDGNPVKEQA